MILLHIFLFNTDWSSLLSCRAAHTVVRLKYFSNIGLFSLSLQWGELWAFSKDHTDLWEREKDTPLQLSCHYSQTIKVTILPCNFNYPDYWTTLFQMIALWSAFAISHKMIHNHNKIHHGRAAQILWQCKWPPTVYHFRRIMYHPVAAILRRLAGFNKQQHWKLLCYRILVQGKNWLLTSQSLSSYSKIAPARTAPQSLYNHQFNLWITEQGVCITSFHTAPIPSWTCQFWILTLILYSSDSSSLL